MDSQSADRGKRIIVLNDNIDLLNLMRDLLTEEGYEVIVRHTTSSVHDFIIASRPDLIILDVALQERDDGWLVLQMVKLDPVTTSIPVLVASADSRFLREKEEQLSNLGCLTIEKPFDLSEMLAKIEQALET